MQPMPILKDLGGKEIWQVVSRENSGPKPKGQTVMRKWSELVIEKFAKDGKDAFGRDIDVRADIVKHQERVISDAQERAKGKLSPQQQRRLKLHALDSFGLYKEMEARDINPDRDSAAKFFEAELNTPLFPQFLADRLIVSRISSGLLDQLTYADIPINRLSYDKVRLSESEDSRKLRNVDIGVDLPLTELAHSDARIAMRKYGRRFVFVREVMSAQPLPIIEAFMMQIGRQLAVDETDEVIQVAHDGDGETPSNALVDTANAAAGTLVYGDLVTLEMAFNNNYAMSCGVASPDAFINILNMAEYKDPLARRSVERINGTPSVPTPAGGGRIFRWSSTGSASMAQGNRVFAVDQATAMYVLRDGDILQEAENIIDSGKQKVALSYKMAAVKGDPNASKSLHS